LEPNPEGRTIQAIVLQLFPFAAWLATATSVVMLVLLHVMGELTGRAGAFAVAWFLVAASCQFAGDSQAIVMIGLGLQTLLAIGLIVRWRMTA
jgi:hypothetical protein